MTDGLVGVDIGTSSVKVIAAKRDGAVVASASRPYDTRTPHPGWAEQDADEWFTATREAIVEVLVTATRQHRDLRIVSVGFTGQMHSFVLLDEQGNPIRPAITWMDSRARDLIPEVVDTLASRNLVDQIQNHAAPGLTLLPILWLGRHEPETMKKARSLLLAKDYVRYRFTGVCATDPTDASGTMLLDMPARTWLDELRDVFGLDMGIFPEIRQPWDYSGTIDIDTSDYSILQLLQGAPAAIGCADQQAAALANNVLSPGTIQVMLGTGSQIATPLSECPDTASSALNTFCHHRGWLLQGSIQNAGSALNWIRQVLGADWNDFEAAISDTWPAPSPFFVPYLTGERTPVMNATATGAWANLRQSAGRGDLLYAGIEGVVFGITDALDTVLEMVETSEIEVKVGGGGARSAGYLSLLCNTAGRPLHILTDTNTTAIGAAMLGAVAAELFPDIESVVSEMATKTTRVLHPEHTKHLALRDRRKQWKDVTRRLL